jgi:hypothetical protein
MIYTKICCNNFWTRINNLVRYVSKVVPIPQAVIQTARWHSTRAELFRNPTTHQGVVYQCGVRKVLFVVSRIAIASFRSEKIQDQVSQQITPKNDYFSVAQSVRWNWLCINRTLVAWFGRGETTAGPPRSPDLTPLKFLCGDMLRTNYCSTSSCRFGRSAGSDNWSSFDHRCGLDSYDLWRNRLQMWHLPRDTRKPHCTHVNICK